MDYVTEYFNMAQSALETVLITQRDNIGKLAEKIVKATLCGGMIYVFGATHAGIIAQEAFYRTGGLVNINPILPDGLRCDTVPITDTSRLEQTNGAGYALAKTIGFKKGDLLIVHSVSGRNPVPIEMALYAGELGADTACITSLDYSSQTSSRASCGKKLYEACATVVDDCVPYGDAAVEIEGFEGRVSPLSTVTGAAIINAAVAQACGLFVEKGVRPPVFVSANVDGGFEKNSLLLDEYKDRIIYMRKKK